MAAEAPRELWVEHEVIRQDKALGQAFGFRLDDGFCAGMRVGVEFPGSEGAAGEGLGATAASLRGILWANRPHLNKTAGLTAAGAEVKNAGVCLAR